MLFSSQHSEDREKEDFWNLFESYRGGKTGEAIFACCRIQGGAGWWRGWRLMFSVNVLRVKVRHSIRS